MANCRWKKKETPDPVGRPSASAVLARAIVAAQAQGDEDLAFDLEMELEEALDD